MRSDCRNVSGWLDANGCGQALQLGGDVFAKFVPGVCCYGGGRAELGQQEHHGNQLHRHWFKYVSVLIFSVTLEYQSLSS
jgi:hypothetical protein